MESDERPTKIRKLDTNGTNLVAEETAPLLPEVAANENPRPSSNTKPLQAHAKVADPEAENAERSETDDNDEDGGGSCAQETP